MPANNMQRRPGPPGPGGGSGRTVQHANNFGASIKRLVIFLKGYLGAIIAALVCSAIGVILTVMGPDKISDLTAIITDGMAGSVDMDGIFSIGITLVIMYAASALLTFAQSQIMVVVTQRVTRQLREDISHKINRLPMAFFHQTTTGDILSVVTNDVDLISQSLNQSVSTLFHAIVMFIVCLIMMLVTSPVMTLVAVVAVAIGFVLMMIITSHSQKYFSAQQKHLGILDGHVEEIYSGHTVVKAYNGEKAAEDAFNEMNENLRSSGFKANALSGLMQPIMVFIGNFGYVAVCVAGALLTMNGTIGFEVIIAFMMYVRYFTQPLQQIAQGMQSLQNAAAASERVFGFLDAEEMEDESSKEKKDFTATGEVVFDNVRFGYNADKEIIHGFNAEAHKGQKIAIVGPTGAGKTTLVNLLMRFYEVDSGSIYLDGIKSQDMTREQVRDQFCMVLQDTWVFEGTVKENLVYNQEGITDEQVVSACKAVGLHHFIKTLPKGYDTVLSDEVSLSQGQKQELTIARAMLADKPILILDEATSSVDTRTELRIQNAMDELMKGRTSFVIAHRLSTIKNADVILVFRDGNIVEQGNHDELMAKNGFYAELYNSQFEQAS